MYINGCLPVNKTICFSNYWYHLDTFYHNGEKNPEDFFQDHTLSMKISDEVPHETKGSRDTGPYKTS